jgi:multidrug resistance efflux pump
MKRIHKKLWLALAGCLVLGAATGLAYWNGGDRAPVILSTTAHAADERPQDDQDPVPEDRAVSVNAVRPRLDPSFSTSIEQPAFVDAYYQADLMARLAGPVKTVVREIGDEVKAGDELIKIDAPDLQADLEQRESVIQQRLDEQALTEKNVKMARAAVDAAAGMVKIKQSEVQIAQATQSFRQKQLKRFQGLSSGPHPAMTEDILDERTQYSESAVAATATARAGVEKAKADLEEARAKLEAAEADIKLKKSLVQVARNERDKARALLDFATLRAPFDGVVARREVDPGSFVQNAATHPNSLMTIARTDIVTVYMKVPDSFAPLVRRNTEAIIQMNSLPGVVIHAPVTRFAPTLDTPEHDRTMRVEVDLYNGKPSNFKEFVARQKARGTGGLKSGGLPVLPKVTGDHPTDEPLGLLPGQYGKMRLVLRNFKNSYFLPSTAVFSQGGTSYVFLVKDGHVVKTPVEIMADNGHTLKLVLLERINGGEARKELTGNEEIVSSNQGELTDGQPVNAAVVAW